MRCLLLFWRNGRTDIPPRILDFRIWAYYETNLIFFLQKVGISLMASPQIGFLRRATQPYGQNCIKVKSSCCAGVRSLPNPMGVQFFKLIFFAFLIPDSDFSWKSIYTNYFYFFNIPTGTWSKLRKTAISPTFLNLPQFFTVFSIFDNVPVRILKK